MVMRSMVGQPQQPLSEAHMGRVLGLNEKAMDYTHADRNKEHDRFMLVAGHSQHRFYVVVIAFAALAVLVALRFPDKFADLLWYIGGALSGFGYGKVVEKSPPKPDGP